jgi:hypothetical protein
MMEGCWCLHPSGCRTYLTTSYDRLIGLDLYSLVSWFSGCCKQACCSVAGYAVIPTYVINKNNLIGDKVIFEASRTYRPLNHIANLLFVEP